MGSSLSNLIQMICSGDYIPREVIIHNLPDGYGNSLPIEEAVERYLFEHDLITGVKDILSRRAAIDPILMERNAMNYSDWQLAETVARELVNRETDVNELQKAITYARIQTVVSGEKVGENFFALLDTMVRDGRFLMRSGRTLDYYRNLQSVCGKHLSNYRTARGEEGKKLVEILAWAARLMRYYNTDAGDAELIARQNERAISQASAERQPQADAQPIQPKPPKKERQPKPEKPPVQTETIEEAVTLTSLAVNRKGRVRTEQGEEITCMAFPAYPIGQSGETCIAEVKRENGRAVSALFRSWK